MYEKFCKFLNEYKNFKYTYNIVDSKKMKNLSY